MVQLRRRFGLTQTEFARLLGVSLRMVSRLETGASKPTHRRSFEFDILERVADTWFEDEPPPVFRDGRSRGH